jgi:hypothetical protein
MYMEDEVVPIENPPPAEPPAIKTKVDIAKELLMDMNHAEVEHVIRHLVKNRDDLLIYFVFTKEVFTMDNKHFKAFKDWLLFNNVIELPAMLKEAAAKLDEEEVLELDLTSASS